MRGPWKHYIEIAPDSHGDDAYSERSWYAAAHAGEGVESATLADGSGTTIELALCDLIDALAGLAVENGFE